VNIEMIYASCRGIIGYEGGLPVHVKEDLQHFKAYTKGKVLVMGRKTVESLPKKLEGRTVVCLTTQKGYENPHANIVLHSKVEVLEWCQENKLENLVIAGGRDIYKLFMRDCQTIVHSRLNHTLIPIKEFRHMVEKVEAPDLTVKGPWTSADVMTKTPKMVVVKYVWGEL